MQTIVGIILLLVTTAMASTFISTMAEIEGQEGLCYTPDKSILFPVGTTIHEVKKCQSMTCFKRSNGKQKLYLEGRACGKIATSPPCKIVDGKADAPYPACCQTVKCPQESDLDFVVPD